MLASVVALVLTGCGSASPWSTSTASTNDVDPGPWVRTIDWPLKAAGLRAWGDSWFDIAHGWVVLTGEGVAPRAVDPSTGAVLWRGGSGQGATLIAGGPPGVDTGVLAVAGRGGGTLILLNATDGSTVARLDVPDVVSLAWAGDGRFAVATRNDVRIVGPDGVATVEIEVDSPRSLAFDPGRAAVWATANDSLIEVDPIGGVVLSRIELKGCNDPRGVDIDAGSDRALVACGGSGEALLVSLSSGFIAARAEAPDGVARVLFAGAGAGAVAVGAGAVARTYDVARRALSPRGEQILGDGVGGAVVADRFLLVPIDGPLRLRRFVARFE